MQTKKLEMKSSILHGAPRNRDFVSLRKAERGSCRPRACFKIDPYIAWSSRAQRQSILTNSRGVLRFNLLAKRGTRGRTWWSKFGGSLDHVSSGKVFGGCLMKWAKAQSDFWNTSTIGGCLVPPFQETRSPDYVSLGVKKIISVRIFCLHDLLGESHDCSCMR